jgi:uncharacterized protein YkwD
VGLAPLKESPVLDKTAQQTADYLAKSSQFTHLMGNPEAGLGLIKSTLTAAEQEGGEMWTAAGENLGITGPIDEQSRRADVFNCFTQSPNHRSAMLRSDFTEIGIGWAEYPEDSPLADGMEDYVGPAAKAGVIVVHFAATAEQ